MATIQDSHRLPLVEELQAEKLPSSASSSESSDGRIRRFRLSAGCVTVELCSLGASIVRLLLPSHSATDDDSSNRVDDCVLGYASPTQMMESGNPTYLGVVVGRVANRIRGGSFRLRQQKDGDGEVAAAYTLDRNNGPNHLHGGVRGFGHRIWDAEMVDVPLNSSEGGGKTPKTVPGVRFLLTSEDGDQGYPGRVRVTATYSLRQGASVDGTGDDAVLLLRLGASLLSENIASPINLAQHSYFNLAGHSSPNGVLDHILSTPGCDAFLPVDGTSIPTREVRSLDKDKVMDFRSGRLLREALVEYGVEKVGRTKEEAEEDIRARRFPGGVEPYGIDHCYAIDGESSLRKGEGGPSLYLAGRVEHPTTRRRMEVWTDAPGVQIYTANYLDGQTPGPEVSKNGVVYGPWQGVCLETQCYPDSIYSNDVGDSADGKFSDGKCFVLRPGGEDYLHNVEYIFSVGKGG